MTSILEHKKIIEFPIISGATVPGDWIYPASTSGSVDRLRKKIAPTQTERYLPREKIISGQVFSC